MSEFEKLSAAASNLWREIITALGIPKLAEWLARIIGKAN